MTDFSPTSSKYARSVRVCGGIREHYAIVLQCNSVNKYQMGNLKKYFIGSVLTTVQLC